MKEKKVRCYYEITYLFKKIIRHITVCGLEAKENFEKSREGIKDFKIIEWKKMGKRKGELEKRYW